MSSELLSGAKVHSSNPKGILFKSFNDGCNLLFSNNNFPHQAKRNIAILAESRPHISESYMGYKLILAIL